MVIFRGYRERNANQTGDTEMMIDNKNRMWNENGRLASRADRLEYEIAGVENMHSDDGHAVDFDSCTECQSEVESLREEWGPKVTRTHVITGHSTIESPVTVAWDIAMSNADRPRPEVIAMCIAAGVTPGTARTQCYRFFKALNAEA